ncbi:MAG: ribbon-helix-helix protein, CopG family [Thermoleophilia bacterium]|jgi:metal-responsive CopG/Arc/MetJ family transcriptional regulator
MTRRKARTSITIPQNLLAELDLKAREAGRTRSDLVCEAVSSYFASEEERLLAEGYIEMAEESHPESKGNCSSWPEW